MANPRGELLLRCARHQPTPVWQLLLTVSLSSTVVVVVAGLITGYWALMLGTVALMVVLATPVFLYMSRPVAVYENGIVAGREYGMVSVMQRRTMGVWGKFEEAVEIQVPPECVADLHAALAGAYPGPLKYFETGPL